MKQKKQITAIIEREDDWYIALCPELDIASQGKTIEEVLSVELFFEIASPSEIEDRMHTEVFVTGL